MSGAARGPRRLNQPLRRFETDGRRQARLLLDRGSHPADLVRGRVAGVTAVGLYVVTLGLVASGCLHAGVSHTA